MDISDRKPVTPVGIETPGDLRPGKNGGRRHLTFHTAKRKAIGCAGALMMAWINLPAAEVDLSKLPPASDKPGIIYENDIRPLFEKSCVRCHGPKKQNAKLRLDSLAAILKGSQNGKVLEKGKSANSRIVQQVARLDPDEAMPPTDEGEPLTKEQIGLIRAWIDQGVK